MKKVNIGSRKARLGLGSYAYRYNIGTGDFKPPKPMNVFDFLKKAHMLGFNGVQLCENLNFCNLSNDELRKVRDKAEELGLFIEVGMRDIVNGGFLRHLEIAEILSSKFLRVVLGPNKVVPEENPRELADYTISVIKDSLAILGEKDIYVGIENHFDIPTDELVRVVREVDSKRVGLVVDTTNSLGYWEHPEETLDILGPHILSLHLKDYHIKRIEAGYMITGTILGKGALNVKEVLNKAYKFNPDISVIMEMTIRRDERQEIEEILRWEDSCVKQSAAYLQQLVQQLI